jgi:hypothetical protein
MAHTGILPTQIDALGVQFSTGEQRAVLYSAMFLIGYFLFGFATYAAADWVSWRKALLDEQANRMVELRIRESEKHRLPAASAVMFTGEQPRSPSAGTLKAEAAEYVEHQLMNERRRLGVVGRPAVIARSIFDFVVPFLVGGYALFALYFAARALSALKP